MTPFNIRKRLKALLGLPPRRPAPSRPTEPPKSRYPVRFVLPDGSDHVAEARHGDTLARVSGRGPSPIDTRCTDITCGSCQVEVLSGSDQLSPTNAAESAACRANQIPATHRLGCNTQILGPGVAVRLIHVLGEA